MIGRILALALFAIVLAACSSGASVPTNPDGPAPTGPGSNPTTPVATPGGNPTTQPNSSDFEAIARALVPPGSTETSEISAGAAYQLYVSNPQTLDQLGAFWTQAIPAAGLTETGRFTTGPIQTIAFTGPDGGIIATRDDPQNVTVIIISVGINQ